MIYETQKNRPKKPIILISYILIEKGGLYMDYAAVCRDIVYTASAVLRCVSKIKSSQFVRKANSSMHLGKCQYYRQNPPVR